jgi:hypothetical protein
MGSRFFKKSVMTMSVVFTLLAISQESNAQLSERIPRWLDSNQRSRHYPDHLYFTGFAYGEAPRDSSLHDITERTKNDAQADLSRNIWVKIDAVTQKYFDDRERDQIA